MTTTVVFGGGPYPTEAVRSALDRLVIDRVVCADSGLIGCLALGLHCDLLIGDMDSVPPDALERADLAGTSIEHHPVDKDLTDLELALGRISDTFEPDADVFVVASAGGRLDHLIASVALLGSERFASMHLTALLDRNIVVPVHDQRSVEVPPGSIVTVLALQGDVSGLRLTGTRWPLDGVSFEAGTTHGVSNVATSNEVVVSVESGVATLIVADVDAEPSSVEPSKSRRRT